MLIKYIILAFIQGITEPLPISSSGHMLLIRSIFNFNLPNDLNFEIICNFGSFIAILLLYKKDILLLIKNVYKKSYKYLLCIIISTIPVCITGLLFKNSIEKIFNKPILLGIFFLITSILLFLVRNKNGNKKEVDITYKDAIIIGIIQSITIIPGISRCGTVLIACLLCNLKRDTALKYTFMLYFPVSIASLFLGINDLINIPNYTVFLMPYLISMIVSSIITYLSYNWFNNWVKNGKLHYFAFYCLFIALFTFYFFR